KTGFVSGDYIKIVETSGGSGGNTGGNTGGSTDNNTQVNKDGVVINVNKGSTLNMRSGSGTNHSIVTRIPANAKVKVNYKTNNGWYNVNYNGKTGFVSADYIRLEQGTSNEGIGKKAKVINVSTSLNVRAGRGTNYSVVGYLNKDDVVMVLDHKDGWHKIEYTVSGSKKTGYVKDSFIKIL
ncbi:MAG: SH3 domain-containing protein, partial [Sarcina sp.]